VTLTTAREPQTDAHPLTIEMVLPSMDPGGMELVVARLANDLAARGHKVGITVTMEEGSLANPLRDSGHDVMLVPAPGLRTNWRAELLIARFRARRPDVVHVHSGVWLKAARAARAAGVGRVVHTVHGLLDREPWYSESLKRMAARSTDVVVAVSEPLRRYLVDVVGLADRQVVTVLNGIDTATFRPGPRDAEFRRRLGIAPDGIVIGHVARLAPIKNQILLIDAFAALLARVPTATLVIVGDGPERASLVARTRQLGVESSVRFAGEVADTAPVYREFDVFVLSSRAEGTSMSILESLASGVCVVATSVGGNPALLHDGECGVLVPSEDLTALTNAIAGVVHDPDRRHSFGEAGRRHVQLNYAASSVVDRYVDLYRGASTAERNVSERQACAV
jgi:glycosyltransferase involved in cell wall biosynthesis